MFTHPLFLSAPNRGQLAIDGVWEHALPFLGEKILSESDIRAYLKQRQEVAFEVFFGDAFFGFRRRGESEHLIRVLNQCMRALANAKSGAHFFDQIQQATQLPLGANFKFAAIGAVNAWHSVGPFVVDEPAAASSALDAIWEQICTSAVGRNIAHRKAIEFTFDSGDETEHWFAIPISDDFSPFAIRRERLAEALSLTLKLDG